MKLLLFILLFLTAMKTFAHPVIFTDGVVANSNNMADYSDNQLHYTFKNKWAAGVNYWNLRRKSDQKTTDFAFAKLNHLLFRHNGEDSQANIYLLTGAGLLNRKWDSRTSHAAYFVGSEIDWETRKYYLAAKYYQLSSPGNIDVHVTQGRVGISPLFTNFDQLQTWFMVQAMYMPEIEKVVSLTPMLRFFYNNVLWEIGSSVRGDWMLNLMVHF